MSWRTVVISQRAKLDLKMNHMMVRTSDGVKRVFLDEIYLLIVESTQVSMTTALISALMKRKVKVIFCDETYNPESELVSYYGSHDTSLKCIEQQKWSQHTKDSVWSAIVRHKIKKQADLLSSLNLEDGVTLLEGYIGQVQPGDKNNREGHAAKVYFNNLFGKQFSRSDDSPINASLNFGYSIILSAFNREIVALGYLTQFGIFHTNRFNQFNLGSDLMEPYRVIVDEYVQQKMPTEFTKEIKYDLISLLNQRVEMEGQLVKVIQAIQIFTHSVFDALNANEISLIKHYQL